MTYSLIIYITNNFFSLLGKKGASTPYRCVPSQKSPGCPSVASTSEVADPNFSKICSSSLHRSATVSMEDECEIVTHHQSLITVHAESHCSFEAVLLLRMEPHHVGQNFTEKFAAPATALAVLSYGVIHL